MLEDLAEVRSEMKNMRAPVVKSEDEIEVTGSWVVTYEASRMELSVEHQYDFEFTTDGTFTKLLLSRPWDRYDNDGNWRGNRYTFYYVPLLGLDMCYLCCQNFSNLDSVGPKGSSDVLYEAGEGLKAALQKCKDLLPADDQALEQAFLVVCRRLKLRAIEDQLQRIARLSANAAGGSSELTQESRDLLEERGALLNLKRELLSQKG
jgi:hypothetical protein